MNNLKKVLNINIVKKIIVLILYRIKYKCSDIKSYIGLSQDICEPIRIGKDVDVSGKIHIGKYTSIMEFCHIGTNCQYIGAYVSIARGCIIGSNTHPTNLISTSASFYSKSYKQSRRNLKSLFNENKSTIIMNDVWIGSNAIILPGIKIGNGAIIGAGSVVTKDVDDYAIVGGNPAKLIRYRIDPQLITTLLASKWWELPFEEVNQLWSLDINESIDKLRKQVL